MSHTVYILTNAEDETLYIGTTWSWYSRSLQHRRKPWWDEVAHVELIEVPDKETALAMEWALIYSRYPVFNQQQRTLPVPWTGPPPAPHIRVMLYGKSRKPRAA